MFQGIDLGLLSLAAAGNAILTSVKRMTRNDLDGAETTMIMKATDDADTVTGTRRTTIVKSVERGGGRMKPRKSEKNDAESERRGRGKGSENEGETGRVTRAIDDDTGPDATGRPRENPTDPNDHTDHTSHLCVTSTWIASVCGNERTRGVWQKIDVDVTSGSESEDLDMMRYVCQSACVYSSAYNTFLCAASRAPI